MGDLFYPQLTSGVLCQYPLRKATTTRTITNILPDGSLILLPDQGTGRTRWQLDYTELSTQDVSALETLFEVCKGPLDSFTFLDPTGNLLTASSNLRSGAWQVSSLLHTDVSSVGPQPGSLTNVITNYGQAPQEIKQTLNIPSGYQYCFSVYASSPTAQQVTLFRRGYSAAENLTVDVGPDWKRVVTRGRLQDAGTGLTVGLSLTAGQQVSLFGMQLDAQISPSTYRETVESGGVYPSAHWGIDELQITADSWDSFSTSLVLETVI